MVKVDPVTVEIIRNRLRAISKEMVITLIKTAYSSVIYDGKDCSCAVLDAGGQLLTLDAGLPLHIAPMPFSVREILQDFEGNIQPGDLFMVNSPYRGGTHLPDVLVVHPIFYQGQLVFFCAARGHWTDVGGAVPGSLSGKATEIHQEGLIIPPLKLYEGGRLNGSAFNLVLQNIRAAQERAGDIRAHVAACKTAERRLTELLGKYGLEVVQKAGQEIMEASERYMRSVFRSLPQVTASYEDYLDSDGVRDLSLRIKAKVTIGEDALTVDFTGTALESQGPYNTSLAVSHGAVVIASKILFDPYGPMNEGIFRPIKVIVPEGTLLNAKYPAATGGFGEVAYRAIFTVIGALAKIIPQHVCGADYGAINHCYVTTRDGGRHSIFYAYPPGGNGGTQSNDGPSGLRGPSSGDVAMQSLEMVEALHPVLFKAMRFRTDSGGPGRFRGGLGMSLKLQVLSETGGLNIVSDRTHLPPFGVFGGHPALPNEWKVLREEHEEVVPGGKAVNYPLRKGDIVVMNTGGAGGYGDPLERDPDRVRQDVLEGLVSLEAARDRYGVVLQGRDLRVDHKATGVQRALLRTRRRFLRPRRRGDPLFDRGIRVLFLSPKAGGLEEGDLMELVSPRLAAPVRFRIGHDPEVHPGEVMLDMEVWDILALQEEDPVELRSIGNQHRR
ncbi:MAG: hydantoinase B/oxoprolinase family protein [Dehalococcoidia bacterium]